MVCRTPLVGVERVVVKVGTRILTNDENKITRARIDELTRQIVALESRGVHVTIVSSGAVGGGMGRLGLERYPRLVPDRQATAAVGQLQLMKMWEHGFKRHGRQVGQVLLTADDFQSRYRYVHLCNTFESLLRMSIVPIVNENDSVAVRELKYGDNDTLSVQVAAAVRAQLVVLLTGPDGLYTADPTRFADAERIGVVEEVTPAMLRGAGGNGSEVSIGGMRSKILAAREASRSGRCCVIAAGGAPDLVGILEGKDIGTMFLPRKNGYRARKKWIAFTSRSRGRLVVDAGAEAALATGKRSLLSSGVVEVLGTFVAGDVVDIDVSREGEPMARGVVAYNVNDLARIRGLRSSEIQRVLGRCGPEEVVHRGNLVLANELASSAGIEEVQQ